MNSSLVFALFSVALISGCGERAELDHRLEELCARDGGTRIHGVVYLPESAFDSSNNVRMESANADESAKILISGAYVYSLRSTVLKAGDPLKGEGLLQREEMRIVRLPDKKIISERIQYRRAGGDGFHIGHHTTTICPRADSDLIRQTFRREMKRLSVETATDLPSNMPKTSITPRSVHVHRARGSSAISSFGVTAPRIA